MTEDVALTLHLLIFFSTIHSTVLDWPSLWFASSPPPQRSQRVSPFPSDNRPPVLDFLEWPFRSPSQSLLCRESESIPFPERFWRVFLQSGPDRKSTRLNS